MIAIYQQDKQPMDFYTQVFQNSFVGVYLLWMTKLNSKVVGFIMHSARPRSFA
jgi:hypothetical protein